MHQVTRLHLACVAILCCSVAGAACSTNGGEDEDFGETSTLLNGHLGELGDLKPMVSSLFIENSGEILIYMSSVTLTCDQLTVSRWLGDVEMGAQVVEIVVPTELAVDAVAVEPGGAEVNYALGGRSSAYEKSAGGGHLTFTKMLPAMRVAGAIGEGTVVADYADGSDSVKGRFQAEFCEGGQGY